MDPKVGAQFTAVTAKAAVEAERHMKGVWAELTAALQPKSKPAAPAILAETGQQ